MASLEWCDACVLLMPCGRSAHLEAGWAVGAGKLVFIVLAEEGEPELMYLMADQIALGIDEVIVALRVRQEQMDDEVITELRQYAERI